MFQFLWKYKVLIFLRSKNFHQFWPFSQFKIQFYKIGFYYIVTLLSKEKPSKFKQAFSSEVYVTNFNSRGQNFSVIWLSEVRDNIPEDSHWIWEGTNSNIRVGISIKVHISSNWISKIIWLAILKNLKWTGYQNGHWATKMSFSSIFEKDTQVSFELKFKSSFINKPNYK